MVVRYTGNAVVVVLEELLVQQRSWRHEAELGSN